MQFGGEFWILRWLPSSNLNLAMENPSFIDDVPTVSMSAKHIHLATEKNTMGHSGRKKKEHGPCTCQGKSSAVQPIWFCSSYFRSGKQSAAHWLGRAVQSRGGFREKLHAKNAKTWSGRCLCCCAIFSLEGFQTFNLLFDRHVHWKTSSKRQKRPSSACFSLSSKLVKELQPEKALYKIWVTDSGMVKFVKEMQRKKVHSNLSHRLWDGQTLQRAAASESMISNLSHRLRDGQTSQRGAVTKSTISNLSHRLRYGQTRQRAAARKSFVSNLSHRLRDGQTRQRGACTKCTISNLSHKPRDGQTRQRAAASMISNPSHRLRDNQSQQASASFESIRLVP